MNFKPKENMLIDGVKINYQIVGSGIDNLLFLHGFALSIQSWDLIANKFDTSKYRLIFIDIKGFGFSDKPIPSNYSIDNQSKIIYSFLIKLKIEIVTLIAHSYGGVIALYLNYQSITGKISLKIKKEILIAVPAFSDINLKFIKILENDFLSFFALKILPARALAKYILRTTFLNYDMALIKHLERYIYFLKQKNIDESMVQMAKQIMPTDYKKLIDSYKSIKFPILIIWGENDNLIKLENGNRLNNEIATSILFTIPNCGHVPHEENPNETFEAIIKFLNT